jgi:histidinol dehydrogenase
LPREQSVRRDQASPTVEEIVAAVRRDGDAAVERYARIFGDEPLRIVSPEEIEAAYARVPADLRVALHCAAERIERFARAQRAVLTDVEIDIGWAKIGHRVTPFGRAGVYVPGGRFPLPSTLLMCAVPALVAGIASIVVCTPRANDAIFAAARVAGLREVTIAGGAQAIAAMAYGTQNIARVDVVTGPGNAYVAAAKRIVYGECGIDAIAGPSELLVIASGDADPAIVAADLLAQGEHDGLARPILITDDAGFARSVEREFARHGGLCQRDWLHILSLDRAVSLSEKIAPEHLALHGAKAEALAPTLRTFGSLFIGSAAAEVFGDYGAGPNHVLPTGGSARFSSGLSVYDFLAVRTYTRANSAPDSVTIAQTATLAGAEGLQAHRRAALARAAR